MIINGGSRTNGAFFAKHLMRGDTNERVNVCEISGLCAENVRDALEEMEAVARGSRAKNYFYHANINPREDERLTEEQWRKAVDTLERNLGLEGQPRFVVEHEKHGRAHRHVIWSRIDLETMTAVSDSLNYQVHEQTSRELEIEFGLARGESVLVPKAERSGPRPERTPEAWAMFRAQESGIDPRDVKRDATAAWERTDSGQAFRAAIEEQGYILARGDRRDFCIVDSAGNEHSLARRISGARAADVRDRMADIDRDSLPSIAEAQAIQADRQHIREAERQGSGDGFAIPEAVIRRPAEQAMDFAPQADAAHRAGSAIHGAEKTVRQGFEAMCKTGEKLIDLMEGAADFFFATPRTVTPQEAAANRAAMVEYAEATAFERRREMAYDRMMEERAAGRHLNREDVRYMSEADRTNYRRYGDSALDQMIRDREIAEERKRERGRER